VLGFGDSPPETGAGFSARFGFADGDSSRCSAAMQRLTAAGSELYALHQTSLDSVGCEAAGRTACRTNAATAKAAVPENLRGYRTAAPPMNQARQNR
jgi:hypothetical protein